MSLLALGRWWGYVAGVLGTVSVNVLHLQYPATYQQRKVYDTNYMQRKLKAGALPKTQTFLTKPVTLMF